MTLPVILPGQNHIVRRAIIQVFPSEIRKNALHFFGGRVNDPSLRMELMDACIYYRLNFFLQIADRSGISQLVL